MFGDDGGGMESSLLKPKSHADYAEILHQFYVQVKSQILEKQSLTSGLFPRLRDLGNRKVAHIEENIYCAVCLWATSLAFRKVDNDKGCRQELKLSAIKCMRGILACWMKQAHKLEKFKLNQSPINSLHSIFGWKTGNVITEEYPHLQINCVSLFLNFLVQMISSGLKIIFTSDELHFVQNLVYYVERAYRTPDFGKWERGSKYHNNSIELHASSIGHATAALELINGQNLFGQFGAAWSVVYVDMDAHNRNRTILESLLPRESFSKNTDASLLEVLRWPSYASSAAVSKESLSRVIKHLEGKWGFKRFLRDGFGTAVEDQERKTYLPAELKNFDGIESEWPVFFALMVIVGVFERNDEVVEKYQNKLTEVTVVTKGGRVLPQYFFVPQDSLEHERSMPGSTQRSWNFEENKMDLYTQSIYIISQLLARRLLRPSDLDPMGRRLPVSSQLLSRHPNFRLPPADLVVQVFLVSESSRLQKFLAMHGIESQTPKQIETVQLWAPRHLVAVFQSLGANHKFRFTGRPQRPFGILSTSKIYRCDGRTISCYPLVFETSDFYLSKDVEYIMQDFKDDLQFLAASWRLSGRPTVCMLLREYLFRGCGWKVICKVISELKMGSCGAVSVRLGPLQQLIGSSCIEHLDFVDLKSDSCAESIQPIYNLPHTAVDLKSELHCADGAIPATSWPEPQEVKSMTNEALMADISCPCLRRRATILQELACRHGMHCAAGCSTVEQRLDACHESAALAGAWDVVRFSGGVLKKTVNSLAPSVTAILVTGRQLTVGVFPHDEILVTTPLSPLELQSAVFSACLPFDPSQVCLQQELLIGIGKLITVRPELFDGIIKLRIGWILHAMQISLQHRRSGELVASLSPKSLHDLLLRVLSPQADAGSPLRRRQLDGSLNRTPCDFYENVWKILERTEHGVKLAGQHLPQQPTLSDMTKNEFNFSLLVEQLLSNVLDPLYRQIVVETFMVVATVLNRNNELSFSSLINIDQIVHDAWVLFSTENEEAEMSNFYSLESSLVGGTTGFICKAIISVLISQKEEPCAINTCLSS